jgi:thioredoxin-like negative regulator of GroEL
MRNKKCLYKNFQLILGLTICLLFTTFTVAQNKETDKDLAQAIEFAKQNRQIDALPLLEKVALRYPDDAEIQARLGVAILANSVTYKDETVRKKEIARAAVILKKAKKLGTENAMALDYLDSIERGGDIDSVSNASNKDVEAAIREGEGFFGRGEYDKAITAYQRAFKLDPQSYNAVLFIGDCYYTQGKYKESEIWFAKAVMINPDREQAFRFWGDALAGQGKGREALEKFANAFIAETNSRLVFDSWMESVKQFGLRKTSPFIEIPVNENEEEIVIDSTKLNSADGSIAWSKFTEVRKNQIIKFNLVANGREFRSTVSEDIECLKSVVLEIKRLSENNKTLKLNKSFENLIKLDSLGMLDIYTILFIHGGNNSPEYIKFREKNRERLLRFLLEYFADDNQTNSKNIA